MNPKPRPLFLRIVIWAVGILAFLTVLFFLLVLQPGPGGVLAYAKSSDGTDLLVTQKWNGWHNGGEAYTISCYSRVPGGPWMWAYIDHESGRWWSGRIEADEPNNQVKVFSGGELKRVVELHPTQFPSEGTPPYLPKELR
jgi:hypothetical protein